MDDGGRCLSDVISDPSALEYFLESPDELKSEICSDEVLRVVNSYVVKKSSSSDSEPFVNRIQIDPNPVSSAPYTNAATNSSSALPLSRQSNRRVGRSSRFNPSSSFVVVRSPMPPPSSSPSSSRRSPAQAQFQSMHCPSPSGYPVTPSPSTGTQNLYQVRSPASSPLPTAAFVQGRTQTPVSMAPAAIGILQHQQQPSKSPVSSPALSLSNVGGQIMQIIQAPAQHQGTLVRHPFTNVKPIQPKQPQQILPKPAGGAPTQQSYGKSVTLAHRGASVGIASNQASPLMLGQGQAMIPNSANVSMGPQGTLLLNHISLGMGQSPILIPGGHGLPPNVQLLVRPPQAQGHSVTNTSQSQATNTALLAALQVQSQAAQQAFLGQTKTLAGQGQAVVIPGQNLGQQTMAQAQGMRQNVIGGARMVSHQMNQMSQPQAAPLVLQQIQTPQGPITVAISATQLQALQSCGLGVGGGSGAITLTNHAPAQTNIGHIGGVIQGQAFQQSQVAPSLPQGLVLNNQPQTITSAATQATTMLGAFGDTSQLTQVTQLQHSEPLQQVQLQPQPPPPPPPKHQSVNLEELLKQAGIMPEDTEPSPPPPPPPPVIQSMPESSQSVMPVDQLQPVVTFAPMTTMVNKQCLPAVNGPQTVIVNHDATQSQLLAQLQQQPLMATSHLQSQGPVHTQVKFALGQDGNFYIQRPMFSAPGTQLSLQPQGNVVSQHLSIPVASLGAVTSSVTTSPVTVTTAAGHSIHSVLLQRLNATPQSGSIHQEQLVSDASPMVSLSMSGINMGLVNAAGIQTVASTGFMTIPVMTTTTRASPAVTSVSSTNTILGSMLSHQQVTSMQEPDVSSSDSSSSNHLGQANYNGKAAVIQQNPLLFQSLQTLNGSQTISNAPRTVSTSSSVDTSQGALPLSLPAVSSISSSPVSVVSSSSSLATAKPVLSAVQQQQQSSQTPGFIVAGYPVGGIQPGHKVQTTIQLTPQGQEALQKIQAQLRAIFAQKPHTQEQWQQIQQLQNEQQKILSQGKVISIQQHPPTSNQPMTQLSQQAQVVLQQHQQQQPRQLLKKPPATVGSQSSSVPQQAAMTQKTISGVGVSLANLLTQQASSQMATFQTASSTSLPSTTSLVTTTTATHVKIGNQIIALTPQQQRQATQQLQVVKTITADQQQQLLLQQNQTTKQALILKLQQQSTTPTTSQDSGSVTTQPSVLNFTGGILQIQTIGPGVTHLKPLAPAIFSDQINRGLKRPASTPVSRATMLHQQLTREQNAVLKPDCRTPFKSKMDACKRLLQYHVFNSGTWSDEQIRRDDEHFELVSKQLLERTSQMLNKYRYLLLKESMKETSTAEKVMLERVFIQEETLSLEQDRQAVKDGIDLNLPSPPDHWLDLMLDDKTSTSDGSKSVDYNFKTPKRKCEVFVPVTIKQEPTEEQQRVDPCSLSTRTERSIQCKEELKEEGDNDGGGGGGGGDDVSKVSFKPLPRMNTIKNYDEWAEIQKELEMFPLDNEEQSSGHIGFDPTEDGDTSLVDFEPPVSKTVKSSDDEIVRDAYDSHYHHHHHPSRLLNSTMLQPKNDPLESDSGSTEWTDAFQEGSEETMDHILARRQAMATAGHQGKMDPNQLLHRIVGSTHETVSDLIESTFKSSSMSPLDVSDVIANGSFDRLQDEDLSAQVESAINSILNLQRIDESCDAFVASVVQQQQRHFVQQCNPVSSLQSATDSSEDFCGVRNVDVSSVLSRESEDEEEEGEDDVGHVDSRFAFEMQSSGGKVDMDGMDYEAGDADLDGYAQDGPSEMDVALDEAVKSILL